MKHGIWTVLSNGILRSDTQQGALFMNNLHDLNEQTNMLKDQMKKRKKINLNLSVGGGEINDDPNMSASGSYMTTT
jgi:hypothetical protein